MLQAKEAAVDPIEVIQTHLGWDRLTHSAQIAEGLTRSSEDDLRDVVERYPSVRKYLPAFLAAFTFRAARSSDPLLGGIDALKKMYREGRSVLAKRVPLSFLKPQWIKIVCVCDGLIDRRAYEIAVLVHLRERLGSGSIWVDGSRAYRTLDDYQLPEVVFSTMRAEDRLGLAVPSSFSAWLADRQTVMSDRMTAVEQAASAGTLVDVTIERGQLSVSPLRRSPSDQAELLKARLYGLLPRIRITDLLVEVAAWSGFTDYFVHARNGEPTSDQAALMGSILADATNLGLGRMAESSR
ncbi:Tn3 family transposase, partial [Gluconobacter cerinus]|uniref:Tn3 family transposase n=1 Tax=Gluconobacter cerinus TaxID=38307 RepID=UPI00222E14F5